MSPNKLPNLIIAGVTKAGTTSLFMYLKQHPDICASSVKETCYFLPVRYHTPQEPLSVYQNFFAECGETKFTMEATPGYYYGGRRVAQAIREAVGEAYVIVVLREPISRMFSFYKYLKSRLMLPKKMTFGEYVKQCEQTPLDQREGPDGDRFWGIDGGFYDNYLQDWVDVFGDKLRIVFFDELMASPTECAKSVCAWLGLDGSLFDGITLQVENRSVNFRSGFLQRLAVGLNDGAEQFWRRFPKLKQTLRDWYYRLNGEEFEERIPAEVRQYLGQIFRPHNQRLAEGLTALGYRGLPAWLGGAK